MLYARRNLGSCEFSNEKMCSKNDRLIKQIMTILLGAATCELWAGMLTVGHQTQAIKRTCKRYRKAFFCSNRLNCKIIRSKLWYIYMPSCFNNVKFKRPKQQTREQSLRFMIDISNATAAILWQVNAAGNWKDDKSPNTRVGDKTSSKNNSIII